MLSSMRRPRTQPAAFAAETTAPICISSRTNARVTKRGWVATAIHREELVRAVMVVRGPDPTRKGSAACGKRCARHRLAIL